MGKNNSGSVEFESTVSEYTDKNITGYREENRVNVPLTITANPEENVMKIYYVKNEFNYTVEYYYDGVIDSDKTDIINATYQDEITEYTDKVITGYKLDKTEGNPLTVTENEETNVIKVYYVKDNFGYSIEYYYDGIINSETPDQSSS